MSARLWAVLTVLATAAIVIPVVPVGPKSAPRELLFTAIALVLFAITMRTGAKLGRRFVLVLSLAGLLFAAAVRPAGSEDVYSYAVYGRIIAAHHANPYRVKPAD